MLLFEYIKELISYQTSLNLQTKAFEYVLANHDLVYVLAMRVNPVLSLGRRAQYTNLTSQNQTGLEQVRTERGGLMTYHGPEQVLLYPLIHLRHFSLPVNRFVYLIEQSMIDCLAQYGVCAQRLEQRPGVYVNLAKIGFVGLHIQQNISTHGLALNVHGPIAAFSSIDTCGFKGQAITSLSQLIKDKYQDTLYETLALDIAHRLYAFVCDGFKKDLMS